VRAGASADRPFFDLDCPGGADGRAPMRGSRRRRFACRRLSGGSVSFTGAACRANVATLLLARAAGRQKELSVRRAGESCSRCSPKPRFALAGGAAGLLVAAWGLAAFRSIAPAQFAGLPGIAGVGIDGAS